MGLSAAALSNVALASQIGGGITSAFGAYGQASTQRANLGAQAAIAEANARISELGAQAELADGNQRIANATQRYGQLKSSQRAAMAANGIAIDQGSAADVLASTDELKAQDRATLEINAMRAAFGQRMQASNQRSQAAMSRASRRKAARTASSPMSPVKSSCGCRSFRAMIRPNSRCPTL